MQSRVVFVAPACTCCVEPRPLSPRDDLPGGLAVCEATGQLYRPEANGYVPTTLPNLASGKRPATSVQIDLSRNGYS